MSLLRHVFLAFLVSLASAAYAENAPQPATESGKRIAVVSMFPDSVPYMDQGFGSFTRNKIEVKKHAPDFELLLKSALERKFSERGVTQVSIAFLPNTIRGEIIKGIESEGAFESREDTLRPFLAALKNQEQFDVLVVAQRDEVSGENFRGVGVVTKLGLLGITNLTRAFFSTSISVWDVASARQITYGNARKYQQFPAIYQSWDRDMKNGPNATLEARMDEALSDLALHTYSAAIDDFSGAKISEYFGTDRTQPYAR